MGLYEERVQQIFSYCVLQEGSCDGRVFGQLFDANALYGGSNNLAVDETRRRSGSIAAGLWGAEELAALIHDETDWDRVTC